MSKSIIMNADLLFNDIHNVTEKIDSSHQYIKAVMQSIVNELDRGERQKYNHLNASTQDTDQKYQNLETVLHHDPLDYFVNSGEQLFKVYGGSMLYQALDKYYHHIMGLNHIKTSNPFQKFVRNYYPLGYETFSFVGGTGYDINDELFANVPLTQQQSKHPSNYTVGSGEPTQRFISYLQRYAKIELV